MENKVCAKCGAELLEGQEFCSKCGTPANKKVCSKCGALLNDDQEFCPKCGQKVSLAVDAVVSSAINQFNANLGEKKKKKSRKPLSLLDFLAERMGFEPMCDCSQTDFERFGVKNR